MVTIVSLTADDPINDFKRAMHSLLIFDRRVLSWVFDQFGPNNQRHFKIAS
jgi:hypothetical protein